MRCSFPGRNLGLSEGFSTLVAHERVWEILKISVNGSYLRSVKAESLGLASWLRYFKTTITKKKKTSPFQIILMCSHG